MVIYPATIRKKSPTKTNPSRPRIAKFFCLTPSNSVWLPNRQLLAGGFNPFEKYLSNWESFPNRDKNEKCLKPPPRLGGNSQPPLCNLDTFRVQITTRVWVPYRHHGLLLFTQKKREPFVPRLLFRPWTSVRFS